MPVKGGNGLQVAHNNMGMTPTCLFRTSVGPWRMHAGPLMVPVGQGRQLCISDDSLLASACAAQHRAALQVPIPLCHVHNKGYRNANEAENTAHSARAAAQDRNVGMGKKRLKQPAAVSGGASSKKQKPTLATPLAHPQVEWEGNSASLILHSRESVTLLGEGLLTVQQGCLLVNGHLVTPASSGLHLSASARSTGPLQLQAGNTFKQAPLTAHHQTRATVHSLPASAAAAPCADEATTQAGGCSFQLGDAATGLAPWPVPDDWWQALDDCCQATAPAAATSAQQLPQPPFVAVVTGPKNAGKSMFARLLTNSLLNTHSSVFYLDADCGQAEFTPPGMVSLHECKEPIFGPTHQHMRRPCQAYFLGDVTPKGDPSRYLHSIAALYQEYQRRAQAAVTAAGAFPAEPTSSHVAGKQELAADTPTTTSSSSNSTWPPLVVNTHGWVTGLGLDMLGELLRLLQPTHVVQLQSNTGRRQLPEGCFWDEGGSSLHTQLLQLPGLTGAAVPGSSGGEIAAADDAGDSLVTATVDTTITRPSTRRAPTAAEARGQQWAAWAAQLCGRRLGLAAADAEDYSSIAAGLMCATPFKAPLRSLQVQVLQGEVAADQLGYALNGAVVGLAAAASADAAPGTPQPCLGLGLVRAVDGAAGCVYLLTDLAAEQLQRVACLQLGHLELPDKLLSSSTAASPYYALFSLTGSASGAGQIRSRNNLLRTALL